MKYKKIYQRLIGASMLLALFSGLLSPVTTFASLPVGEGGGSSGVDCPDEGDCAKKTAFAFDCGGGKDGIKANVGISCLIITVLNFLSVAVGLAVVGGVTFGGIKYSTSAGSPAGTQQGMKIIGNSVLGLVLWILLWAIVQWLVPGGIFT